MILNLFNSFFCICLTFQKLTQKLETIYADSFVGEPGVVYAWVECIQEFINQWSASKGGLSTLASFVDNAGEELSTDLSTKLSVSSEDEIECPDILTGGCIEDRKSVFQPHFAEVHSVAEVKAVSLLLGQKMIVTFSLEKSLE